jgi:hypothetical protein
VRPALSDSPATVSLKLLAAGAAAAGAATLVTTPVVWLAVSTRTGLAWALGALGGLAAMVLGQVLVGAASKLTPATQLAAALGAYAAGIAGVITLFTVLGHRTALPLAWAGGGVIVAGLAYGLGVVLRYPHLRIPVFDEPPDETSE